MDFQVNADRKNVAFVLGSSRQRGSGTGAGAKGQAELDERGRQHQEPDQVEGASPDRRTTEGLREGKSVKLGSYPLKDGTSQRCIPDVLSRQEVPAFHIVKNDPMRGKVVALPANESETQVAVNHQGKTNEATKKVDEALQRGQVAPKGEGA